MQTVPLNSVRTWPALYGLGPLSKSASQDRGRSAIRPHFRQNGEGQLRKNVYGSIQVLPTPNTEQQRGIRQTLRAWDHLLVVWNIQMCGLRKGNSPHHKSPVAPAESPSAHCCARPDSVALGCDRFIAPRFANSTGCQPQNRVQYVSSDRS